MTVLKTRWPKWLANVKEQAFFHSDLFQHIQWEKITIFFENYTLHETKSNGKIYDLHKYGEKNYSCSEFGQ